MYSETDLSALYVSYLMGVKTMGKVQKSMFEQACTKIGADTLEGWKKAAPSFKGKLKGNKELWRYAYDINTEENKTTLDIETVCACFEMLLPHYGYKIKWLPEWIKFLEDKRAAGKLKVLAKDIWDMLPAFY